MIILRGYYPEKYTGKDRYIKFLFRDDEAINVFHNWNILNFFHPKFTYFLRLLDVYTLYSIKVFMYLLFFSLFKPDEKIVIDSQENIFLIDLITKFHFKSISVVFYDFASADQVLNHKDSARLQQVDKIIVMTEHIKTELLKKVPNIHNEKVKVILYKLEKRIFKVWSKEETDSFRLKHSLPEKYLLYVGSEQDRKNFFTLLQAFELLSRNNDDIHLVKIGKDQSRINRKKLIHKLEANTQLKSKFKLVEECNELELVGYYNCAVVFVFPSLYEGFGIPLVEAMACHVPIITSNIPTSIEICQNAAIYFKKLHDSVELKNKIVYMLNEKNNMRYRKLSADRSKGFVY